MNKCLNCGKEVKNKYCNVSCQNIHQGTIRADKKYGLITPFKVKCKKCEKEFEIKEREKLFPRKEYYYCSKSCANSREHSDETKNKIRNSLSGIKLITICKKCGEEFEHPSYKKRKYCSSCYNKTYEKTITKCKKCNKEIIHSKHTKRVFCSKECNNHIKDNSNERIITICKNCNNKFEHLKSKKRIFCSQSCVTLYYNRTTDRCVRAGLKSCSVQKENRRSKNEIYFAELCKKLFNNVTVNEQIFNGWDADVILNDQKIAVLWNGKWHYNKIKKDHSVKQVQNRDRIKINEIKKCGYSPYIIKDMGKFNKEFVEKEFEKFKHNIAACEKLVISEGSYPSA